MPKRKSESTDTPQLDLDKPKSSSGDVSESEPGRKSMEEQNDRPLQVVPPKPTGGRTKWQELFIPVHGLVRLRPEELKIVDHPAFQRLGEVYQLGQTHLVYRGATHKRLEHALGSLHVAQTIIDALKRNSGPETPKPDETVGNWALDTKLNPEEIAFARLGALLHDIGHLPAGHTLEDELGLIDPHDGDQRLNLVLDMREWRSHSFSPTLRELIDTQYSTYARDTGLLKQETDSPLTASEILYQLISKDHAKDRPSANTDFRLQVCRDIIGNTICADLLDYLHRDWLHLGKRREFDTRLLEYMEVRRREAGTELDRRLVINLRGAHRVRTDAVTAILDLLESRYQLAEIALFHRTKLCAAAMLERILAELADISPGTNSEFIEELPRNLLNLSDSELYGFLEQLATDAEKNSRDSKFKDTISRVLQLVRDLRMRRLHKEFVTAFEYQLAELALEVQNWYSGPEDEQDLRERAKTGAGNRLRAVRLLEKDFALPVGSIVMYCPPRKMNVKIAEVQVLVHGDVHTLDGFETNHGDRGVTGGHLKAQKERFRRLWRILVAISPDARAQLIGNDLLGPLGRAIELCVQGRQPPSGTIDEAVRSLARELASRQGSPLFDKRVITKTAARSQTLIHYPGGAPSLLACVES